MMNNVSAGVFCHVQKASGDFEVAVVGAGPAGATCGYFLGMLKSPSLTVLLQQFVKQTLLARSSANSKLTFFYVLRRCLILTFVMHSRSGLE